LILAAFGQFSEEEAHIHQPSVVFVDQYNRRISQTDAEQLGIVTEPVPNPT